MSDLIRREDVMALWDKYHYEIATKAVEFDKDLREIPSAEPKKGKWIRITDSLLCCSECGMYSVTKKTNRYCRACGARMEADHETD